MTTTVRSLPTNLADNVRALRESRGLSQQQMAKLAGVPRPTWAHLESGAANPTMAVLVRIADALEVRIEELIGPPRAAARLYRAGALPARKRGAVTVRQLLPDAVAGLSLERMELPAGGSMTGIPHTPGTREYLESGEVEPTAAGQTWRLDPVTPCVPRRPKHGYRPGRRRGSGLQCDRLRPDRWLSRV
jgi:transcriptional regulator with XRE-family HTH domain